MLKEELVLFRSGEGAYHTYRIPALVVTQAGTLLAFCEGRRHGRGDAGDIDILVRRSEDHGRTWGPVQCIVDAGPDTAGNPTPVVDQATGTIWLLFTQNRADGPEELICQGKAPRTVWVTYSTDDGRTWATPREITGQVKRSDWTWYATGPGHAIQLSSGRLLIPCDHMVGIHFDRRRDPYRSHVIYSDDHGQTWQIGGVAGDGTNECMAVESTAGHVYLNCRSYQGDHRRAYTWSADGGLTFGELASAPDLVEPVCQASLIRLSQRPWQRRDRVLFANPASTRRERFTLRLSYDECRSWTAGQVLYPGPAAYSDLCVTQEGTVGCLYERGVQDPYEELAFARLDLEWLTDGAESEL